MQQQFHQIELARTSPAIMKGSAWFLDPELVLQSVHHASTSYEAVFPEALSLK